MNVQKALKTLENGNHVRTTYDGPEISYIYFKFDKIARMLQETDSSARTVSTFTPEEFLENHKGIEFVLTENNEDIEQNVVVVYES